MFQPLPELDDIQHPVPIVVQVLLKDLVVEVVFMVFAGLRGQQSCTTPFLD